MGTLSSVTFVGHQIGSFLGAYVAGVVYDRSHDYRSMWYGSLAIAIFAVIVFFLAGVEPISEKRRRQRQILAEVTSEAVDVTDNDKKYISNNVNKISL